MKKIIFKDTEAHIIVISSDTKHSEKQQNQRLAEHLATLVQWEMDEKAKDQNK